MARILVRWSTTEVFEGVFDTDDLGMSAPSEQDLVDGVANFETEDLAAFEGDEHAMYAGTPEREVLEFGWVEPGSALDGADR